MRQWGCFGQPTGGWLALDSSSLHLLWSWKAAACCVNDVRVAAEQQKRSCKGVSEVLLAVFSHLCLTGFGSLTPLLQVSIDEDF